MVAYEAEELMMVCTKLVNLDCFLTPTNKGIKKGQTVSKSFGNNGNNKERPRNAISLCSSFCINST